MTIFEMKLKPNAPIVVAPDLKLMKKTAVPSVNVVLEREELRPPLTDGNKEAIHVRSHPSSIEVFCGWTY